MPRPDARLWIVGLGLASCFRTRPPAGSDGADSEEPGGDDSGGAAELPTDLALIADTSNGRYLYVRLADEAVVREVRLAAISPEQCGEAVCTAFAAWPRVGPDGADELTISFAPNVDSGLSAATIARVRVGEEGDAVLWQLDQLDFLAHFSDQPAICAQESACEVPDDPDASERRKCRLALSHEVAVVEEDETSVTMWIADTQGPTRALKVRLDKAGRCGEVLDVLSEETADLWAGYESINDVDEVDLGDGRETLLLTSLSQGGGEGLSAATLWQKRDGAWTRLWQHPAAGAGNLNAAHNADWIVGEGGQAYLVYANSNGLGGHALVPEFTSEEDNWGSIGVARATAAGAEYLFDAAVPGEFGFLRDANRLADGSYLVTDSGCMHPDRIPCDRRSQLWHVALPDPSAYPAPGLSGAFTPDHAQMNAVPAEPLASLFAPPLLCGLLTPYTAQLLPGETLGSALRALAEAPGEACPAE